MNKQYVEGVHNNKRLTCLDRYVVLLGSEMHLLVKEQRQKEAENKFLGLSFVTPYYVSTDIFKAQDCASVTSSIIT